MLSHTERKILNVCFHLNRKGVLSISEICNKTRKTPEEVEKIIRYLHELGYLTRNKKGQVEVNIDLSRLSDQNVPSNHWSNQSLYE